MAALGAGAVLVLAGRWMTAAMAVGSSLLLVWIVPSVAASLFVKPNEISLERPYIEAHIEATRQAWGLSAKMREVEMRTNPAATVDIAKNQMLLDNVRLWDWRPFHDTVTQMQALRPYYSFHDTDVDRYIIDGTPARFFWPRARWISASYRARSRAGSTPISFIRMATAWCWPK